MKRLHTLGLVAKGQKVNLKELSALYKIDGCNIEGYTLICLYQSQGLKVLWVNLCTFLDFPLAENPKLHSVIDGKGMKTISDVTSEWIAHQSEFPLKEYLIKEFDVPRNNYVTLMILTWYIDHARELTGKKNPKIVVQCHRGGSGITQNQILEKYLLEFYDGRVPVDIKFCVGYKKETLAPINGTDLHISLSLILGLNELHESGDILVPDRWSLLDTEYGEWSQTPIVSGIKNHFTERVSTKVFEDSQRAEKCSVVIGFQDTQNLRLSFGGHIAQIDKIYEPKMQELFRVVM